MIVYALTTPAGETALVGWGPDDAPLRPLTACAEGRVFTDAVAEGRLVLRGLLGASMSRLNAAQS